MTNDEMRATWTSAGVGWVEHQRIFDSVFAPVTAALLDAADLGPRQRVLDVGCGSGTLLAAGADRGASMVGIDISPTMVEAARHRVPEATVVLADAQTAGLLDAAPGAAFDRVVSRFGVMFFADPVVAFTRIWSAATPDARLAFACWRTRAENPMFSLGTDVLVARMAPRPEQPPYAPGPTAFAEPDRLHAVLEGAGWTSVTMTPVDFTCDYGVDGSDGVEERMATMLATTTGQAARAELEPVLGPAGWAALLDEARREVAAAKVDGVVRFPGAIWLVTAEAGD
ncbi:class I SAM-dependent methyltransferase [Nocardioides mangrovi]|uniref:Class I SAM-dependent methyltransferase n=1 Tax=Nocardioides mangrovi TaxID=2874580 RepID=A0ABS7UHJ4_9ACTN|nr:class I SAM-dependent methyltransferase [Nocardioides mangrovi]MBZ5740270.1 class I SAM-dependent methyltransferase [Nocardioides mangrovi]